MAQRGTTPLSKQKSLTKQKTQTNGGGSTFDALADQERINRELVQGLTENEVEIEHLKTTVIAVNEKVEVRFNIFSIWSVKHKSKNIIPKAIHICNSILSLDSE